MKNATTSRRAWTDLVLALFVLCAVSIPTRVRATGDDSLASARSLYAAAEYEQALGVLESLKAGEQTIDDRRTTDQYRAYCLIALGRSEDAEQAIGAVVTGAPLYTPSGSDVSPRVRSAFSDVRRRLLPSIVQAKYATAKTAFDRQQFVEAHDAFRELSAVMADPDMAPFASEPTFADLRMLTEGFLALSAKAMAPAPLDAHPPTISAPAIVTRLKVYDVDDADVVAPVLIKQTLPPFPRDLVADKPGVLELVIDEAGTVETVAMRVSLSPRYDKMLTDAASGWQYRPATVRDRPVKYRKVVHVEVKR